MNKSTDSYVCVSSVRRERVTHSSVLTEKPDGDHEELLTECGNTYRLLASFCRSCSRCAAVGASFSHILAWWLLLPPRRCLCLKIRKDRITLYITKQKSERLIVEGETTKSLDTSKVGSLNITYLHMFLWRTIHAYLSMTTINPLN